ncbi:hypothetical protein CONPUDRAFT_73253 [Coniophora puteana RWD-64-598 SS2]|uniref:PWI domain-containing protein n=1 Tax=Coniophora puteana (strain RWD-64-598) TaxID=741705 RepID=A0A5M3MR69_CONPW|nr:uncharacterized protein CONPUDRAFT_73253 [Coniophora puteana RWD-64-598 SS2]EIW81557.1 hypothetical protein CONPUDRAFT_73253 [Coniophora puteana RWD-64-598 SS2]
MQPMPNRLGLGMRPGVPSFGQGPSMSALAQQAQMGGPGGMALPPPMGAGPMGGAFVPPGAQKTATLFVGSISGGITDAFLNRLLATCGPVKPIKRLITPANKPQGFGFAEFDDADSALRAITLLQGVELPALEDGCANKKLLIKADEKTKLFLDAFSAQKMKTDEDEARLADSRAKITALVDEINALSAEAANSGLLDKEKYVIPPHLHDLQEADLPETQRGLVISEIAQFRESAAKREREKLKNVRANMAAATNSFGSPSPGPGPANGNAPNGPKTREWGKPQGASPAPGTPGKGTRGASYGKAPAGFVKAEDASAGGMTAAKGKTDEELEEERKEARRREEENSYRDRERRYEPRERTRLAAIERSIARQQAIREAEERDRVEMQARLDVWDDDESDEMFYVDRARWRQMRARRVALEEQHDSESRMYEEREAENLRIESEKFLARQMEDMQALADEQRRAGMLLDDGAPVRLNMSLQQSGKADASGVASKEGAAKGSSKAAVAFNQEEEEEEATKKRKVPLVKLDFGVAEGDKAKERLKDIQQNVPHDKESLFKGKVRWDGLSDSMIDRKLEPLIKRQMVKYLGELEDDDLIMFVLEHLKDHKGPQKLIEGLEPVLEEEAQEFVVSIWRQVIFESMAYSEGLHTERLMVDE